MDIERAEAALQMVAWQYGKDVSEIKCKIEEAIAEAMQCEDPAVQARWRALCVDGRAPTAAELLVQIGMQVIKS